MRLVVLILLMAPLYGYAAEYGPYTAHLNRVIDGDTVVLDVAIWPDLTERISVRLDGVNAPETHTHILCEKIAGQKAKQFTEQWMNSAGQLTLSDVMLGKFAGRVLGRISNGVEDLGDALLRAGLARPYDGGKRQPWCTDKDN